MNKNRTKEVMVFVAYFFALIVCRGSYLYIGEGKTLEYSLRQVGIEVGNLGIIVVFGFLVAVFLLYIGARIRRKIKTRK